MLALMLRLSATSRIRLMELSRSPWLRRRGNRRRKEVEIDESRISSRHVRGGHVRHRSGPGLPARC